MLLTKENIHSRMVLTSDGFKLENNVRPFDKLYEYGTNKLLEVKDIEYRQQKDLYVIHYSDERDVFISDNELLQIGKRLYYPYELIPGNVQKEKINLFPVIYNRIYQPLDPDPYTAGILFGYGDYTSPYIDIPSKCSSAKEHVYYSQHIDDSEVTWRDLFGKYRFYANEHNIDDPPIPIEYLEASYNDRVQFIRGVFDAGYEYAENPDSVSLIHWDENRLNWIQHLLWSMGILSRIYTYNGKWRLDIEGEYKYYPGFFYNNFYIRNMVDTDNRLRKTDPEEWLVINSLTRIKNDFKNEVVPHFIFDEPKALINEYYLPKISN